MTSQNVLGKDILGELQTRLSAEMQRHAEAVAVIQDEMQRAIRGDLRSLVEGQGESTEARTKDVSAASDKEPVKRELTDDQKRTLLSVLNERLNRKFEHYKRPEGVDFGEVRKALEANPTALWSLSKMEETGGAPDIVAVEENAFIFADCSAESPMGRRNCVYDKEAEKYAKYSGVFSGNAVDMAEEFGVKMWSPEFYRRMQEAGKFDHNTWSWLATDAETRSTGGALVGDRHGGLVHVYQRDAEYHRERGAWRGLLRVQKVS